MVLILKNFDSSGLIIVMILFHFPFTVKQRVQRSIFYWGEESVNSIGGALGSGLGGKVLLQVRISPEVIDLFFIAFLRIREFLASCLSVMIASSSTSEAVVSSTLDPEVWPLLESLLSLVPGQSLARWLPYSRHL